MAEVKIRKLEITAEAREETRRQVLEQVVRRRHELTAELADNVRLEQELRDELRK